MRTKRLQTKLLHTLPFSCGLNQCPKNKDVVQTYLNKNLAHPLDKNINLKGCVQFNTSIYGLSDEPQSDLAWEAAETIGVVLPNPDPTGLQGTCRYHGVSRDIILESIWNTTSAPCIKVAIFYLVRGFSVQRITEQRELKEAPLNPSAISYCKNFLLADIEKVKPSKFLLCGPDVGNAFFSGEFSVPDMRREQGKTVTIGFQTYPAQVTFDPFMCTKQPAYLQPIYDDCKKLFNPPVRMGKQNVQIIQTLPEALKYFDFLENFDDYAAVDYETENLNRKATNRLATMQFATSRHEAFVLPVHHRESPFTSDELKIIFERIARLYGPRNTLRGWLAHGSKFEQTLSKMHFGTMIKSAPVICTQALFFLLDETRSERKADVPKLVSGYSPYSLKLLAKDFLGFYEYDADALAAREDGALFDMGLYELADYGGMDGYVTHGLADVGFDLAMQQGYFPQLLKMLEGFYDPMAKLCAEVETNGFKVNLRKARMLASQKGPYEKLLRELEGKLRDTPLFKQANLILAAEKNAGQPKSVTQKIPWVLDFSKKEHKSLVFFDLGEFEPVSWSTKTSEPSIDGDFFDAYSKESVEVDLFSQYEETKKMRDTFISKILERIDPQFGLPDSKLDQRLRPNIHYTKLVTGRLAMSEPNLQQIPKPEEGEETEGTFFVRKAVKDLFTVDKDCSLIQIDYKVNEVRWAAILSGDPEMARIFSEAAEKVKAARLSENMDEMKRAEFEEDIHRNTASAAFGVTLDQVTKTMRSASKAITFGILFQQGLPALAAAIKVTIEEAEEFQNKFFQKMVEVGKWIERMKHEAYHNGFVEAPHGRRRRFYSQWLPESYLSKRKWVGRSSRQAVNSPIQGIASDAAMCGGAYSLLKYIEDNNLTKWIIQNIVHDSCLLQVPKEDTAKAILIADKLFVEEAMEYMTNVLGIDFNLPLGIDVEAGHIEWGSLEKWNGTVTHAHELHEKVLKIWENPVN